MPNYLGVDYGTKRIGLAWSDDLGIALPIGAFPGVDDPSYLEKLREVVDQKKINEIIVGYPIHMDGTPGVRAKEVDVFINSLEEVFEIPVHRVDERLTSLTAEQAIGKKTVRRKKQNLGKIDALAAGLILSDFLESRNIIPPPLV